MFFNNTDNINVPNIKYFDYSDNSIQFLSINMNHPILGTGVDTPLGQSNPAQAALAAKYVRKAIASLVPYQKIVDNVYGGLADRSSSLWSSSDTNYDNSIPLYHFSYEKAIQYFEMAGYSLTDLIPLFAGLNINFLQDARAFNVDIHLIDTDASVSNVILETDTYVNFTGPQLNTSYWNTAIPADDPSVMNKANITLRLFIIDNYGFTNVTDWMTFSLHRPKNFELNPPEVSGESIQTFTAKDEVIVKFNVTDQNPRNYIAYLDGMFQSDLNWANGTVYHNFSTLKTGTHIATFDIYDQFYNMVEFNVTIKVTYQRTTSSSSSDTTQSSTPDTTTSDTSSAPAITLPVFNLPLLFVSFMAIVLFSKKVKKSKIKSLRSK